MSKELYPVGFARSPLGLRPKVASDYLLERMAAGGINEAYIILRPGKWDIPAYCGDGTALGVRLAYLTVHVPFGVPFSLNQAVPFIRNETVALGFPDILFWPENAFKVLLERLWDSTASVVLGLFPTDQPEKVGVVDVDDRGIVQGIYEKSEFTHVPFMWAMAVWNPEFTSFLHEFIEAELRDMREAEDPHKLAQPVPRTELPMGDVIHRAIRSGIRVEAEIFGRGSCIDIGTPNNLLEAIRHELPVPAPRSPEDP